MENREDWLHKFNNTSESAPAQFNRFIIPLVRRIYPGLNEARDIAKFKLFENNDKINWKKDGF